VGSQCLFNFGKIEAIHPHIQAAAKDLLFPIEFASWRRPSQPGAASVKGSIEHTQSTSPDLHLRKNAPPIEHERYSGEWILS
jgi:hypothetical protein